MTQKPSGTDGFLQTPDADGFSPTDWEGRLAERMAEYELRKAREKAERAEFKRRRNHGLARRHATKLRRNAGDTTKEN